jgi:ComF family protein
MLFNYACLLCQIAPALELGVCEFCYSILPFYNYNQNYNQAANKIYPIFYYQDPIKKLILDLKFKKKIIYADFLGKILAKTIINKWYLNKSLPSAIIPVPLHIDRLRTRGFNQAFELAKPINVVTTIKINNTACVRIKNTVNQISLLKHKRKNNTNHAFLATKILDPHIAILDDVVTTGSTIKALCNAIVATNPNINIDIWCICRA